LARHIRSVPRAAAALALVAGLAAPPDATAQAPPPAGAIGGAAAARPRVPSAKALARRAPPLMLLPSWTVELPSAPYPGAAIDGTRGFVVVRSSALVAITLETGATAWSVPTGAVVAPPLAAGGLVFLAREREVEAVEASTGAHRWSADLGAAIAAPLCWTPDGVLVLTEPGGATMLAADSGRIVWTRALGAASRIQPATGDGRAYVALDDGRVVALAPATGQTAWEVRLPSPAATIDASRDRVLVGDDKFLYCLSAKQGHRDWRWPNGGPAVGRVASDEHHLYFAALDNVLRALDRRRGYQIWKAPLAHRPVGGVFLAGRLLWVPGVAAAVAAFDTSDGSAVSESALAGDLAAAPQMRVSASGALDGAFVVSADGQAQWLVPGPPPLPAKPIPWLPIGPPDIKGGLEGGQPATGAF
jgi:outer membrane protein assembly factor BamB